MKIFTKLFISFSLVPNLLGSVVSFDSSIMNKINKVAKEQDIEPKLLLAFAEVESNGNIFAVGYNITKEELKSHKIFYKNCKIKMQYGKYKDGHRISVYPKNKTEAKITLYKVKNRKNVDYGLMQINSSNLVRENISKIAILTDPYLNLTFSAKVLRGCFVRFKASIRKTAECYNKGYNDDKFDFKYFNKIKKAYYGKNGA